MWRYVFLALGAAMVVAAAAASVAGQSAADLIADVRAAIAQADFARAEAMVTQYRSAHGATAEAIEATSWLARGALAAKQLDKASQYAAETYREAAGAFNPAGSNPHVETALGAAIEVQALVRATRGERSDAVYFLQRELDTYRDTAIHKRIQKNINLLSLEGKPAPPLETHEYLGRRAPTFEELKGKVVLLFFWAHWCPDCKAQSPILAKLLEEYRARGLVIVAPTQRYGYVVSGERATPDEELRHIVDVRDKYYAFLRDEPVPISERDHKQYGVSSTPTLALVDRRGVVRLYHPGRMSEKELEAAVRGLL